jgi:hypothetical protein
MPLQFYSFFTIFKPVNIRNAHGIWCAELEYLGRFYTCGTCINPDGRQEQSCKLLSSFSADGRIGPPPPSLDLLRLSCLTAARSLQTARLDNQQGCDEWRWTTWSKELSVEVQFPLSKARLSNTSPIDSVGAYDIMHLVG